MSGLDLNTYMKYTGMTLDKLREEFRPQAERQVKVRLALEKIAELESVSATAEEIAAEYDRMASAYNMPVDQIKASLPEDAIVEDLKVKKTIDLVREKAVVTDAAPKKTTAKKSTSTTAKKTTSTGAKKTTSTTTKKTTSTGAKKTTTTAKKTTTTKKAAAPAEETPAETPTEA